jgi:hypothetical protein
MVNSATRRFIGSAYLPRIARSLLGILCLLAGVALAAHGQQLPRAPQATVIDLTPEPGHFTEPSIAIDPRNPQHVVAAFQDNAHAAYSFDAGRHWQVVSSVAPANYRVSGDVSIAYDNHGHAILCYMAFDKLGTFNYWAHNASRNGLFVRRSLDGGKTWEAQDYAIVAHATEPGIPFDDKPYIVADTTSGPFAGNLYVGWTRWELADSRLLFARSTDGGKTWSSPIELDDHPGLPRDDNGALEGFAGAVAPDGTLHVVWSNGNHIVFTSSRDGGRSFDPARNIVPTAPAMFHLQSLSRGNGFPEIAIDPRPTASGARLYVAWSDYRNGDVDVFCSTSQDQGRTWSPAMRVNSDALHDGADQFFQWLAVDPTDGAVYLIFYDRRNDPQNRKQIVVLARSTDGGRTFHNYAWTGKPFYSGETFLGDYIGVTALGGRVYGIWTEKPGARGGAPKSSQEPTKLRAAKAETQGTIVRVGVAGFGTAGRASRQGLLSTVNVVSKVAR